MKERYECLLYNVSNFSAGLKCFQEKKTEKKKDKHWEIMELSNLHGAQQDSHLSYAPYYTSIHISPTAVASGE